MVHTIRHDRPVTGIASHNKVVHVGITPLQESDYESGLKVFGVFANRRISVDFIDIRAQEITFIIDRDLRQTVDAVLKQHGFRFAMSDGFATVSVIGAGMLGLPGVMETIVEAMRRVNACIHQTTGSNTSISCLISQEYEQQAVNSLHRAFGLSNVDRNK